MKSMFCTISLSLLVSCILDRCRRKDLCALYCVIINGLLPWGEDDPPARVVAAVPISPESSDHSHFEMKKTLCPTKCKMEALSGTEYAQKA